MNINNPFNLGSGVIDSSSIADAALTPNALADGFLGRIIVATGTFTAERTGNMLVMAKGGGGGGASGPWNNSATAEVVGGYAGVAGDTVIDYIAVTKGDTVGITIGSGGAGGAGSSNATGKVGTAGGDTIITVSGSTVLTATGGVGGSNIQPGGGTTTNLPGQSATAGGGIGGPIGATSSTSLDLDATEYGCGGGGSGPGVSSAGTTHPGGAGKSGIARFWYV